MAYREIAQELRSIFGKIAGGGGAINPDPAEPEVAGVAFFLRDGRVIVINTATIEGGGENG